MKSLLASWQIHLSALNYSKQTLGSYLSAATKYLDWCESSGAEPMTRRSIQEFSAHCLDEGAEPATARLRHYALKAFAKWLITEGELEVDPFAGLRPPKMTTKVTPALTEGQISALLSACGPNTFVNRRDEAILRFLLETGARSSELVGMRLGDLDLPGFKAVIVKGKGGKGRVVPFSAPTAAAVDRYLRARAKVAKAGVDALWVSIRGKPLTYDTLYLALKTRAAGAGVANFHPHITRNTAATRWLRHGGSESGLMAVAGWTSRAMIDRYTAASASERALEESRRLNLGHFTERK